MPLFPEETTKWHEQIPVQEGQAVVGAVGLMFDRLGQAAHEEAKLVWLFVGIESGIQLNEKELTPLARQMKHTNFKLGKKRLNYPQ